MSWCVPYIVILYNIFMVPYFNHYHDIRKTNSVWCTYGICCHMLCHMLSYHTVVLVRRYLMLSYVSLWLVMYHNVCHCQYDNIDMTHPSGNSANIFFCAYFKWKATPSLVHSSLPLRIHSILVIVICFASRSLVRLASFADRCSPLAARRYHCRKKKKTKRKRKPHPPPTATPTTTLPKAKPLKTTGRQSNALNPALPLQLSVLFRHRRQGLHSGTGLCARRGSQESRPRRQSGAW